MPNKRARGLKLFQAWLNKQDRETLQGFQRMRGLKNQSEAIRAAIARLRAIEVTEESR